MNSQAGIAQDAVHGGEMGPKVVEPLISATVEQFSFIFGGPLHRLQVRFGYARQERSRVARRALFMMGLSWLPLLLLSIAQGLAYNRQIQIPFVFDLAVSVRFLIAMPILILTEIGIDRRLRRVVRHFIDSRLVTAAELPSYEAVIRRTERLRDRIWPELLLVLLAFGPSIQPRVAEFFIGRATTWHVLQTGAGGLSYAGWWFVLVSAPLFRFLLLRWLWRIVLWAIFIWRVTHLNLHLVPTHPDLAAGLGFLTEAQKAFSSIVFAGGVVISGNVANTILYEGATLASTRALLITYVVLAALALIAPLLLAAPSLVRTRNRALFEFGALSTAHDQAFDARWIGPGAQQGAEMLGNPDASSLADLSRGFETVREMRAIPLDRRTLIALVVAAALPMAPVILIATPTDVLIRNVLKILG
jgi:hypothetical protein